MLDEVFIKKITDEAISKYRAENGGKNGVANSDVIWITMRHGGDMDDVRAVMAESVRRLMPEKYHDRFI